MYRRDGQISLYLFQTRNLEVEAGVRLFTVLLETAKGVVRRFRVVRSSREGKIDAEEGTLASSMCPSRSPPLSSSPTMALTTSRLRQPGPTGASPPLALLLPAGIPPLAHFPLDLDASTLAAQDEGSFADHVLAILPAAIIFPPLQHTFQGALVPPSALLPAAKVGHVSLTVDAQQQEQQHEFARRARKAEVRRRRRRVLKEQQQEQKEREKAPTQKKSAKGAARE